MAGKVKSPPVKARGRSPQAPAPPPAEEAAEPCGICAEPLDDENRALCHACGRPFHLKWDVRASVRDCGLATLDEVTCGLLFVCSACAVQQGLGWKPATDARRP